MGLYYTEIKLPTGRALAAATDKGLSRLELCARSKDEWLEGLKEAYGARPVRDDARFGTLRRELEAYFAGRLKKFTASLDVAGTPFQKRVWAALAKLRYGSVVTYGGLAARLGNPTAARAVGGALNANHVPIIIPCHRVVAAGGKVGGYGCGVDIKRILLEIEGLRPPYLSQ